MIKMKVKLLSHTQNPDKIAGLATRTCWSEEGASEINEEEDYLLKLLEKEIERGHESVVEHSSFTFSIEEVSRSCTHQLVRHRIASYSQQSQRHVKPDAPEYVTPPKIKGDKSAGEIFKKAMNEIWRYYNKLLNSEIPPEDARFLLPNAAKTNIVVTMNSRSLLNFFELRCCLHAQWEIRSVANEMLKEVKKVAPRTFENAGPPCKRRGICTEKDEDCPLYDRYVK